eukprot:4596827-Amphidinium_carterae.1
MHGARDVFRRKQNSWFHYDMESGDGNSVKDKAQLEEQSARILSILEEEREQGSERRDSA